MTDIRVRKLAQILVDHSIRCQPGDRVLIEATTLAEPLVRELYSLVLERGGHPHLALALADQDELFMAHAGEAQLDFIPTFQKLAYETFEARIRIGSMANTRAMSGVDPNRLARRQKALAQILQTQMKRGAEGSLKWVSTLFPTAAYAMEAEMALFDYENFVYRACHADEDTPDPAAYWRGVDEKQQWIVDRLQGHDQVVLRGPNVDLSLSIKGRTFLNSAGRHNMPDGEVYTGPVEDSVNGWIRYTYPAVYQGRVVEGVSLTFENGKVVKAAADKNQDLLLRMLDIDPGARYLGEFAMGTNFEIDRSTKNILFDEKIGGSFHTALGAGYPETGSLNKSLIHWDLICDMKTDAEILVDGEVLYRNGEFLT
jgi:aminopeptidase